MDDLGCLDGAHLGGRHAGSRELSDDRNERRELKGIDVIARVGGLSPVKSAQITELGLDVFSCRLHCS